MAVPGQRPCQVCGEPLGKHEMKFHASPCREIGYARTKERHEAAAALMFGRTA